MNVVVLTKERQAGEAVKEMLMDCGGIDRCSVTGSIRQAVGAISRMNACCLFFDREMAHDFEGFFERIHHAHIFFVVMSEDRDNHDAIDAINTGRIADYLISPLTAENVQKAVSNLAWRLEHSQVIFLPYQRRHSGMNRMKRYYAEEGILSL